MKFMSTFFFFSKKIRIEFNRLFLCYPLNKILNLGQSIFALPVNTRDLGRSRGRPVPVKTSRFRRFHRWYIFIMSFQQASPYGPCSKTLKRGGDVILRLILSQRNVPFSNVI